MFDRHKRAPWIGIGQILSGFAGMWSTQATSFSTMGSTRVFDDAATIAINTPITSLLADYYPPESRGRVFALFGLTGPIIGIFALAAAVRWSTTTAGASPASFSRLGRPFRFLCVVPAARARARLLRTPRHGCADDVALTEDEPLSISEGWRTLLKIARFAAASTRRFGAGRPTSRSHCSSR